MGKQGGLVNREEYEVQPGHVIPGAWLLVLLKMFERLSSKPPATKL